ncbi:glycosyltransferase [Salinimicrobium sp. GXAS 041]|uniref:glycosyltransferase n=1 Tax=Salinimicrobium sp. GXAS 041 TaxID=3400806 RepID=UPI003C7881CE
MDFKNKNILLILHAGVLGGAERQGLGLGRILVEKYSCNVYLLLTHSEKMSDEFKEFAEKCHIQDIFHFGEPYIVLRQEFSFKNLKRLVWSSKYLLRMRKGLLPYKIDLIFPFLNFPSKIAFYLYKLLPTAKFTFWHQLGLDVFKDDVFEKLAAKYTPGVIANAPNGIELFREAHKLEDKRAFVLPQFLTMKYKYFSREETRQKYHITQDSVVIGMVSHYRPDKKHELLLQAFLELTENFPNINLIFLGYKDANPVTLEKYERILKRINSQKLQSKVLVLSGKPVEEILSIMDIGVLVSEIEGTPNVVMEYMLYELPIIASRHPGCVALLDNSPFLIENNIIELKKGLATLIASKNLRKKEGMKNKEIINRYTPENYMNEFNKIMNALIDG